LKDKSEKTDHAGSPCPLCPGPAFAGECSGYNLPAWVNRLVCPNDELAEYYRLCDTGRLLKCPRCGTCFIYSETSPGGSDDAMETSIYLSIKVISPADVHILLADDMEYLRSRAASEPDFWLETYRAFSRGVEKELKLLQARAGEVVSAALDVLEEKRSLLVSCVYRERQLKYEQRN